MSDFGMEPWQVMFHNAERMRQERRNASVPDYGDWDLYDDGPSDDDDN